MKVSMQSGEVFSDLQPQAWDAGFVGIAVDERGRASIKAVADVNSHVLSFRPKALDVLVDGDAIEVEQLEELVAGLGSARILLEATTLGIVEILVCCRAIARRGGRVGLLYTEPAQYFRRRRTQLVHRRDFALSDEVQPFSALPGSAIMLGDRHDTRAVFLVGYEGERLDQAIEQTGVAPEHCHIVFGVPAFQPGWETNSFANNIRVIGTRGLGPRNVMFAGADNPAAALRAIESAYRACSNRQRLLLSPIGTKPHAIAAALFACVHDGVGLVFDHPQRSEGRSEEVGTWHYFDVDFG